MARDQRTNRRIRAPQVRVVGPGGEQLGVLTIEQALSRAGEAGLDLVEVNPMSKPPVCKIMDYGKFKYEEKKKTSEAKKKQVVIQLKEVKLRPKTEEHDYEFKVRNVKRFLEEGNKARITIMFRGREITHRDRGQSILEDVVKDVKDIGVVEQAPRMEGRQMFMILSPTPRILQRVRDQTKAAAQASLEKHKGDKPQKEGEGEESSAAPASTSGAPAGESNQAQSEAPASQATQAASAGPK